MPSSKTWYHVCFSELGYHSRVVKSTEKDDLLPALHCLSGLSVHTLRRLSHRNFGKPIASYWVPVSTTISVESGT